MDNYLVTIIVPIHNLGSKGDYCLKMCLDSILAQTFHDYEVLLMENGSTDDTVEVAKEYCNKDNRFKLHILTTTGIANARNEGVKVAQGQYISFIDGDDTISKNYLEDAVKYFNDKDVSFVATSSMFVYPKKEKPMYYFNASGVFSTSKRVVHDIVFTIWAKIIRADSIKKTGLYLVDNLFGCDDVLFAHELYLSSKKYAVSAESIYYYTQNRLNQTSSNKLLYMVQGKLNLAVELEKCFFKYNVLEDNKDLILDTYFDVFIGRNFALTPIRKLDKKNTNIILNDYNNVIQQLDHNDPSLKEWQKRWLLYFKKAVKSGYGYYFIKWMRYYRNLFIKPFRIKWYK